MSQVVLQPYPEMNDEQFFEFCQRNRDLRIERTAKGEVIIMPPTGGETGNRNAELNGQVRNWTKEDKTGKMFDSSTGFKLPNGAERSPGAGWVTRARLAKLSLEQKRKFIPLCPDFVVELRSPSDELEKVKAKMDEYIANGTRLGWLIDPETRKVHVYRPNLPVEILDNPQQLSGDPELPGFVLELQEIWEPCI